MALFLHLIGHAVLLAERRFHRVGVGRVITHCQMVQMLLRHRFTRYRERAAMGGNRHLALDQQPTQCDKQH